MDWWQWSANLISLIVGSILGSILTFVFTRFGAAQERKSRERDQLRNAIRSILVEVKANLNLAKEDPERGRLWRFPTYMWDAHKGNIIGLPEDLQDNLHRLYVFIQRANSIYELNLTVPYGSADIYDSDYGREAKKIAAEAEKVKDSLSRWLALKTH